LRVQNSCSMFQRWRYHLTICWASAAVLTACVVSNRQCNGGSGPEYGPHSRTSTTWRATLSCERVQVGRTRPRPALVNVGLTVADHGDQLGSGQHRLGGGDAVLPALGFLCRHWPLAASGRDLAAPHPQLGPGQPEAASAIRRDRQQRVQKQALVKAIADRAQPPRAPRMSLKIELCGVPGLRRGRLWIART